MNSRVLFLSHGGGPLPLLGDRQHLEMVENLKTVASKIERPSMILVVSAHWEEQAPMVTSGANPALIYDYYGFPEESYHIQYPAPGAPELARQVVSALTDNGVNAGLDDQRGFDHGLYVPLKIMFPDADIPCIQLSLMNNLDPRQHIRMGAALATLQCENLLIIGSGFSFHNMRAFFAKNTAESQHNNEAFEKWLIETCSSQQLDEMERTKRLENWESAPFARYCHPREEHLLPLHVCYGAAGRACSEYYAVTILNKQASVYLW